VDQVVVDERRHVDELDGDTCSDRRLVFRRGRQEGESRPEPLTPGRERARTDRCHEARVLGDTAAELRLDLGQGLVAPGCRASDPEGGHAGFTPTCSATMPAPSSRYVTSVNPAFSKSALRSSGPGKRRTLAGR